MNIVSIVTFFWVLFCYFHFFFCCIPLLEFNDPVSISVVRKKNKKTIR